MSKTPPTVALQTLRQVQWRRDAGKSRAIRAGTFARFLRVSNPFHEASLVARRLTQRFEDLGTFPPEDIAETNIEKY
jgi:hypothetical protein